MKHLRLVLIAIAVFSMAASVSAQSWKGMSRIELSGGYWMQNTDERIAEVEEGSVVEASENGLEVGFGYNYYLKENMALDFGIKLLICKVDIDPLMVGIANEEGKSVIVPITAGVKYYLLNAKEGKNFRAYVSAAPGVVVGQQNRKETDDDYLMASKSSVAFGANAGLGFDFRLGELFMLGARGGYNLFGDFSEPIGGSENYSGLEFNFGFSFLFGNRN